MTDNQSSETQPDGFRKRRKRPKGWYKQAIKDGEIADPEIGIPDRVPGNNEAVVDVPTARMTGKQEE